MFKRQNCFFIRIDRIDGWYNYSSILVHEISGQWQVPETNFIQMVCKLGIRERDISEERDGCSAG